MTTETVELRSSRVCGDKAPASRAGDTEVNPYLARSIHTSELKIGTPVATLLGARCYRVSVMIWMR